jgi:hypothetical protein
MSARMRIAYLITAYAEFAHLERLVAALDDPDTGFFIHIDAGSSLPAGFTQRLSARGNVTFAPRRRVWWGGWSHTAAILDLMELAAASPDTGGAGTETGGGAGWDYCVILSGADYPLRSNGTIRATLAGGGEFINAAPGFRPDKPESRVRYHWFDGFDRRRLRSPKTLLLRALEILLRVLGIRKRRYPFEQVYSGVVWSALSMGCVRHILDYVRTHPRYVRFFRTAQVPEEMFFATIIGNSPFAADIRGTLTYMDWDHTSASPPLITPAHLPRLAPGVEHPHKATGRSYERLFARKFDDGSGPLLDRIDAEFRR